MRRERHVMVTQGKGFEAQEKAHSPLPLGGFIIRESHGEVNLRDPDVNLGGSRGASIAMTQRHRQ